MSADRLRIPWEWVYRQWRPPYRWMAEQMRERGIDTDGHAPVWAWHSCEAWRQPPGNGTIEAQVGGEERRGVVLTLDVPDEVVLLSVYGPWNEILDRGTSPMPPAELAAYANGLKRPLFDVDQPRNERWGDDNKLDIQACLPFLDRDWLAEVRPYDLDSTPSQGPA